MEEYYTNMMKSRSIKDEVQDKIVNEAIHKLTILEHATGLGKSFSALKLLVKFQPARVLILVAETAHKENWQKEFSKFISIYGDKFHSDMFVVMECYASIHKWEDSSWDIVILDESHHLSEKRLDILATINASHFIALSATMSSDDKLELGLSIGVSASDTYHSKITLKQAVAMGAIPEAKVHLFPLVLSNSIANTVYVQTRGTAAKRHVIHCNYEKRYDFLNNKNKFPDLELHIKCTPLQKYNMIDTSMEYWKNFYMRTRKDFAKYKWLGLGMERKRFMAEMKLPHVQKLISKIPDKRFICFCGTIEQADELGGDKALHSKKPKDNTILADFQNKLINQIYVVGMLVEGQNLVDIEAGIVVQLDGTERPFIQKSGRVLRSEDPEQYIFYFKDTQDEIYLNKIIEGIPSESIETIININEWEK